MPSALTWLREHWRPALAVVALVVAFALGWAAHRPAPRLEFRDHQTAQVQQQQHRQEQATTDAHQQRAIATSAHLQEQRHVRTRRVVHVLPSGEKTITTDTAEDDGLNLQEAQQVSVTLQLGTLVRVDDTSTTNATATRDTSLVQTPAAPSSWRAQALLGAELGAGLALRPVYGGQVSRRVLGPLWLGAWGLSSGQGGVSVGVEW